jgi:hypothetical protein
MTVWRKGAQLSERKHLVTVVPICIGVSLGNSLGTLNISDGYGASNPRDRVSGKVHSLVNR